MGAGAPAARRRRGQRGRAGQGVVLGFGHARAGVFEERWAPAPTGPLCVALWGVKDPGNVGTVLRSALAFGVDSVVLGPDTADPFGPKAVRASMGAIFAVAGRTGGVDRGTAGHARRARRSAGEPLSGTGAR